MQNVSTSQSINGEGTTQIRITPITPFTYGKKYSIQFDDTALRDENYFFFNSLSQYTSLIQTEYDYEFTIKNAVILQLLYRMVNNSVDISVDASFTITFDENIFEQLYCIRDLSDNTILRIEC